MRSSDSFLSRFNALVETLRAHPEIEVLDVEVRPPAAESELRAAEERVGMPLPADLRAFYAAHDGVFLEWGLRGQAYDSPTSAFGYPDYGQPPGCINLLPVELAMSIGWEMECHVNEVQPEHQEHLFGRALDPQPKIRAVCVDNFSKYNHGDLIFGPEPVMVVSTDHGADMDSSDFMDFSTYLDATLAVYGLNRYRNGVGIGWTRPSQRITEWTHRPDLDALLSKLAADER